MIFRMPSKLVLIFQPLLKLERLFLNLAKSRMSFLMVPLFQPNLKKEWLFQNLAMNGMGLTKRKFN